MARPNESFEEAVDAALRSKTEAINSRKRVADDRQSRAADALPRGERALRELGLVVADRLARGNAVPLPVVRLRENGYLKLKVVPEGMTAWLLGDGGSTFHGEDWVLGGRRRIVGCFDRLCVTQQGVLGLGKVADLTRDLLTSARGYGQRSVSNRLRVPRRIRSSAPAGKAIYNFAPIVVRHLLTEDMKTWRDGTTMYGVGVDDAGALFWVAGAAGPGWAEPLGGMLAELVATALAPGEG